MELIAGFGEQDLAGYHVQKRNRKNSQKVESNKGTTIYSSFIYGQNSRSSCAHEFSNEAFEVAINHDSVILDDISICSVNRKLVISWICYFVDLLFRGFVISWNNVEISLVQLL